MGKVILSGYIEIPENELEVVTTALEKHIELTRQEIGCLVFEVIQSTDDRNRFNVYEEFVDKSAFELHQERVKASHSNAWHFCFYFKLSVYGTML
ncbi:antibiotic biosynthesis monooxygenase [Vibrio aestuarianus]|uniref:putative quinol monooxygenase n=1 Tax=Vibrio aestuarianus TaxID=28171 RepID=UPI00148E513D|nr:antibiotic biosynthesis monooxygenase [Vibrio aestuarianus]NOI64433.1 antibiotic biosynthesis monooxygenase [Vibrio aestuarianus]